MKRNIFIILLLIVTLVLCSCLVDLSTSSSSSLPDSSLDIEIPTFNINILETVGGCVTANKTTAYEGETIKLNIAPANGYLYEPGSLFLDEKALETNSFEMPAKEVEVGARFLSETLFPTSTCFVSATIGADTARANFFARYEGAGIHVTALVKDNFITVKNADFGYDDNVEFIISLKSEQSTLDTKHCFKMLVSAGGKYYLQKANGESTFGTPSDLSLNIAPGSNFYFSTKTLEYEDGSKGYRVDVYFGYDLLNTNYDEAYGNLTMIPAIRNTNGDNSVWVSSTAFGSVWANPSKFIKIKANGIFA